MSAVMVAEKKLGTLFRLAIRSGVADAIALHIRRGEPVDGRDGDGHTPLMLAAIHGHIEVCARLLDAGADAALSSPIGRTASDLAVENGHAGVASLLSAHMRPNVPMEPNPEPEPEPVLAPIARADPCEQADPVNIPAGSEVNHSPAQIALDFSTLPTLHLEDGTVDVVADEFAETMSEWLPDEAAVAPSHDEGCTGSARTVQLRISAHRRVSNEADWSDIELEMPAPRVQLSTVSHGEMEALETLIGNGLNSGYLAADDVWHAVEADCGPTTERGYHVVLRVLDDLGILVAPFAGGGHGRAPVDFDKLNEAIDVLFIDLPEPVEASIAYATRARRLDLIKREDEERIGRRMDSALGGLTRVLASLPEDGWQLAFPADASTEAEDIAADENDEVDPSPLEMPDTDSEVMDGSVRIDFAAYVALVRGGMPEYGREELVPRPRPPELSRLLGIVFALAPDAGNGIVTSIAAYEKARDHLVTANLRLAMSIAYGYRYRDLPLDDLMQEANLGLMRAAEKYDFRRGFKFSTYATAWIRQGITRGLADTVRLIRVPVHMVEKINAVNRVRRELDHGLEGAVGIGAIAERMSLSAEAVRRIIRSDPHVLSLEQCGPDGESDTPDPSSIVDPDADPYCIVSRQSLSSLVSRMLATHTDREREVLELRFGLSGLDSMTLEEVGKKLDVTRERIRQIEAKVLTRYKRGARWEQLQPYARATCLSEY